MGKFRLIDEPQFFCQELLMSNENNNKDVLNRKISTEISTALGNNKSPEEIRQALVNMQKFLEQTLRSDDFKDIRVNDIEFNNTLYQRQIPFLKEIIQNKITQMKNLIVQQESKATAPTSTAVMMGSLKGGSSSVPPTVSPAPAKVQSFLNDPVPYYKEHFLENQGYNIKVNLEAEIKKLVQEALQYATPDKVKEALVTLQKNYCGTLKTADQHRAMGREMADTNPAYKGQLSHLGEIIDQQKALISPKEEKNVAHREEPDSPDADDLSFGK